MSSEPLKTLVTLCYGSLLSDHFHLWVSLDWNGKLCQLSPSSPRSLPDGSIRGVS